MKNIAIRIRPIASLLLSFSILPFHSISEGFAQDSPPLVARTYVDAGGNMHVVSQDGRDDKIPKEKDQLGCGLIHITEDKRTVGWTVLYPQLLYVLSHCCSSRDL